MLACQKPKKVRKPAVKKYGDREVCNLATAEGLRIYKARTDEMWIRQGCVCGICLHEAMAFTFDHQDGRGMNSKHRNDAIVDVAGNWINAALCWTCNTVKASRRYEWVDGIYRQARKGEAA